MPASKNEVVHAAKKAGAPKGVWEMLDEQLPWITYQHLYDILSALGYETTSEERKEEQEEEGQSRGVDYPTQVE